MDIDFDDGYVEASNIESVSEFPVQWSHPLDACPTARRSL